MKLHLSVVAKDPQSEQNWCKQLEAATRGLLEVTIAPAAGPKALGQVVFVDATTPDLDGALGSIDSRGRAVFLIVGENSALPRTLAEGGVDDILISPFRPLEVLSRIRHYQQILMWDEIARMNASFSELVEELRNDLRLAERIQKSRFPARFPVMTGMEVTTRYLAGMKAGGDHFDLAESRDKQQLAMVLSDSSSYGLCSAVLSVLMKVAAKFSADESASACETIRKVRDELVLTMKDKDKLSLFFGLLSRKDYRLRFLNIGGSAALYSVGGKPFRPLPSQGDPITIGRDGIPKKDQELLLEPQSRLVLLSDGFVEAAGSLDAACGVLNRFVDRDGKDLVNEFLFAVKSKFTEPDDMPAQDCTAVVFDVDSRVIRLAPKT